MFFFFSIKKDFVSYALLGREIDTKEQAFTMESKQSPQVPPNLVQGPSGLKPVHYLRHCVLLVWRSSDSISLSHFRGLMSPGGHLPSDVSHGKHGSGYAGLVAPCLTSVSVF